MSQNVLIVRLLVLVLVYFKLTGIDAIECGTVEFIDPKITKGTATSRGAWPFLAALFYVEKAQFFCGSTVISARHVLTGKIIVTLGSHSGMCIMIEHYSCALRSTKIFCS